VTRSENQEVVSQLFDRLHREFGRMAPQIIQVMVECVGGCRLTFPDLQDLYRQERDRRIHAEFTGNNHEELAIRYRIKIRQVRRVLNKKLER
jgi:Mor family transcriptional regulator